MPMTYPQFNPDGPVVPKKRAGSLEGRKGEPKPNDDRGQVEENNNLKHLNTRETNWLRFKRGRREYA